MVEETCKKLYKITQDNMEAAGEVMRFPAEVYDVLMRQPMFKLDMDGVWQADGEIFLAMMYALFLYRSVDPEMKKRYLKIREREKAESFRRTVFFSLRESEEFTRHYVNILNEPDIKESLRDILRKRLGSIYRFLKKHFLVEIYHSIKAKHPGIVRVKDKIKFWCTGGAG